MAREQRSSGRFCTGHPPKAGDPYDGVSVKRIDFNRWGSLEWPCLFLASLLVAFFHTQLQNYVSPTATLYAHIEATSPLESHLIGVNPGIE